MVGSGRRVGIADVAALAGVSVGTVSKALNGRGAMRDETRARVRAAADELGFAPSAVARSLLSGRTFTVGVITTDSYGRFSIPVMRGAEDALGVGEMAAFLCDSRDDPIREQHYVRTLLARRVDGIIVAGRRTEPRTPIGHDLPVPVVYAFARSADPDDCSVVSDEAEGTRSAVEHLLKTGRRRIAHVTGPQSHASAALRASSAVEALEEAGTPLVGDVWFGGWSEAWGRYAVRAMLKAHPDVDAVFCGSDTVARGVTDALREEGRSVPHDVAVVGVDNWSLVAEACRPPLTSVDLNLEAVGRRAGELLLAAIDGRPSPGVHSLPCRLVVRDSSAPPN
ncbi:LacI family transcriptional regulator [Motilibacter peucedani]|uniref:LacI family transcriptional regulator n=1 Tax=Motilibacter peucedani TaxID=598650 RepID=A0A420XNX6_9ACTN|nr:LacI family DNA-binding transcriptional regulator [Motilibacter peucedani]RKS73901.1 LacI family transcriptional regulator [Motilibacter peucedani]